MKTALTHAYLPSLDLLRGFASLAVCVFHLTNGEHYLPENHVLRMIGSHGWLGVEMFFVISGFVIPYALRQNQYTLPKIGHFLGKRVLRLEPSYLATIMLVIVLNYLSTLSPYYRGHPFELDWLNVLSHLGYLNVFTEQPWLNPVFWTLAIEFQYYLWIALCFPCLVHPQRRIRYSILIGWLLLGVILPEPRFMFHYSPLFILGILIFQYQAKLIRPYELLASASVILLCAMWQLGAAQAWVATIAALGIVFLNVDTPYVTFFGNISYSLYLIHVPVGGRIVNLSKVFFQSPLQHSAMFLGALTLSIFSAWVFYKLIERPSQLLSKTICYDAAPSLQSHPHHRARPMPSK